MAQKELRCDLVTRSHIADCLVLAAPSIRDNPIVKCTDSSDVGVLSSQERQHFLQHEEWHNDHRAPGRYHGSVGHGGKLWRSMSEQRLCVKGQIAMHKPCA